MVATRTRLTTPPGREPSLSDVPGADVEHYVPGPALPAEPSVPGRWRRTWITLAIVVVVVGLATVAFLVRTSGQNFDPALDQRFAPDGTNTDGLPGEP